MSNKDLILKTALDLFNEHGTYSISTNHIAEECGVSPGNLYHHFRNKEAIIAALFAQMIARWEQDNSGNDDLPFSDAHVAVTSMLEKMFQFVWEYRFIHRELASLLQRDSELKTNCQLILQKRIDELRGFIGYLEHQHYLVDLDDNTRELLVQTSLFYGLFWQPYLEVTGRKANKANVKKSVLLIQQLLLPYRRR